MFFALLLLPLMRRGLLLSACPFVGERARFFVRLVSEVVVVSVSSCLVFFGTGWEDPFGCWTAFLFELVDVFFVWSKVDIHKEIRITEG